LLRGRCRLSAQPVGAAAYQRAIGGLAVILILFIIVTESGMLHRLKKELLNVEFIAGPTAPMLLPR
jgi:hypothetical protein